jgi:hypothetical protein
LHLSMSALYLFCVVVLVVVLQARQQHLLLSQLPTAVLQQVLAPLPLQERLGSCSLVCRSMQATAVAATDEIRLADLKSQQKASALCQWLSRHGHQAMRHLAVKATQMPNLTVALPFSMQHLQSLRLERVAPQVFGDRAEQQPSSSSSSAVAAVPGVAAAAAAAAAVATSLPPAAAAGAASAALDFAQLSNLTSLQLQCCSIDCPDVLGWAARHVVHVTGLQRLHLNRLCCVGRAIDCSISGESGFAAAIGQLVQLTSLGYRSLGRFGGGALATVGGLSQLQQLLLDGAGSSKQPLQLQWLPRSLRVVRLHRCIVRCTLTGSSSSGSSSSSSSWQLPVLQQLKLSRIAGFEPAVMQHMPELRVFSFVHLDEREEPLLKGFEQQLVETLPQLQHLQHLQLEGVMHWPSPSSCAALTASSNLTALLLADCSLPSNAARHMSQQGGSCRCCNGWQSLAHSAALIRLIGLRTWRDSTCQTHLRS